MKTATAYFAGNHEYFDITLKCLFFEGLKMKAISQHSSSMETTNLAKRKKTQPSNCTIGALLSKESDLLPVGYVVEEVLYQWLQQ